ncbi:MAG: phosphoribosylformylglycinamidine cyclo-ligase [Ignavibacteriaceae bacterium]|nr:phosphoribosylformylglycinamidine cyclo-ligase [Ignavibacteriaceae bacterium]
MSYKLAGVDISKGDEFIDKLKPLVKKTFTPFVIDGIGNFGAFFEIPLRKYKSPVLVSSIDGVGTKIKLASDLGKFDTIGEDLVNHCVNDIAVCGATPLYFLDYFATGKLNPDSAMEIVMGLVRGCKANKCALIGGETAEMPGIYAKGDFDLAGSITGIADKRDLLDKRSVKKQDVLIGIASSGLHTNGYSLVQKIFDSKSKLQKKYSDLDSPIGEELMKVHRSYLKLIQGLVSKFKVKSIAHITGGGIEGNTNRVVPSGLKLNINWHSIDTPPLFEVIRQVGKVGLSEMRRTFNMGIGLVLIVSPSDLNEIMKYLKKIKEKSMVIGEIF